MKIRLPKTYTAYFYLHTFAPRNVKLPYRKTYTSSSRDSAITNLDNNATDISGNKLEKIAENFYRGRYMEYPYHVTVRELNTYESQLPKSSINSTRN